MKDVVLYVFFCLLYGVLAVRWVPAEGLVGDVLGWQALGEAVLLFAGVATLARWTVLAFKPGPERLKAGQQIVGVEEPEADRVIDVVNPVALKREEKKPRLKKRRLF
ncbi:MAG TPA: hypothetical protein PKM44_02625 [Turneriella sp.]|nr:hypothetical protein [Turneriella sp.]HMY11417.1 hypothetical protein [Turneriella sp.]HNA78315.1 hypothetical protein [Turneriella sp.]HNE18306.1 hypothetical protein [Turneriella sp.]HNJ65932.1 hypothetical protein [Turneriella sp.]